MRQGLILGRAIHAMSIRGLGIASQLLNLMVFTRLFGSAALGAFSVCQTLCGLLGTTLAAGTDVMGTRVVAANLVAGDSRPSLRPAAEANALVVAVVAAILLPAFALLRAPLFRLINATYLEPYALVVLGASVGVALNQIIAGWLLGAKEVTTQVAMKNALVFVVSALVVVVAATLSVRDGVVVAVTAVALAYWVTASVGGVRLASLRWSATAGGESRGTARLARSAAPILVINVINFAMAWVDVLLLSSFTDAGTVGVYTVASRCAALVTLVLMSVNAVVPPMFAERHAVGDTDGLAEVARASARLCLAGSVGLGLGLFFWGRGILGLFGEGIAARGFSVLAVLVLGRIVGSAAGSAGFLLMMSGRQRMLSVCAGITLALGVSLGVLLIPQYGLIGAAFATTAMTVTYNVLAVVMAWVGMGVWSLSDRLGSNAGLGIAAIGVFFAARLVLSATLAGAAALVPYAVGAFFLTRDAGASLRRPHA